jgi:hypothetical protein
MLVNIAQTFDFNGRRWITGENPDVDRAIALRWIAEGKATADTDGVQDGGASAAAVNNWQKTQTTDLSEVAYAASITLDRDTHANHVNIAALTGNLTLANPTGYTKAVTLNVWITQDATGSRTLTLGNKIKTASAAGLTLTTTASAVDLVSLVYNPTKDIWYAAVAKDVR